MKSAVESLSWLLRAVSFKDLKMHLLPSDSSLYFHSCSPKQGSFYYPVGKIDAFELWCWRRLLRVPWTAKRSNQSILNKIRPQYSLEGLMLKLKLQSFGHLMRRAESESANRSVMSNSLWPNRLYSPWNSPGQNTIVGSLSLPQGIFPTQGLNQGLLHCRWIFFTS